MMRWSLALLAAAAALAPASAAAPTREESFRALAKLPDWDRGIWSSVRTKDPDPKLTPAAARAKAAYEEGQKRGENLQVPAANCVPDGMPRIMRLYPIEFLFTPGRVTIGIETYEQTRRIYTDGRALPDDPDPAFNGNSVGHWEGDTLVVDTIGLNTKNSLVRGVHLTENTRIRERIRLENPDRLVVTFTVTDPAILTEPYTFTQPYERKDDQIREYVCAENNKDAADPFGRPSLSLDP